MHHPGRFMHLDCYLMHKRGAYILLTNYPTLKSKHATLLAWACFVARAL